MEGFMMPDLVNKWLEAKLHHGEFWDILKLVELKETRSQNITMHTYSQEELPLAKNCYFSF